MAQFELRERLAAMDSTVASSGRRRRDWRRGTAASAGEDTDARVSEARSEVSRGGKPAWRWSPSPMSC